MRLDRALLAQAALVSGEVGPLEDTADLNLSNKELEDVSLLVDETPYVENLNLAFNHLQRTAPLHKLTHLTRLNLSHNALLDVERLGTLKDLNVLNLSKNKLTTIGSIVELQDLEELWLRDNQISELPVLQHLALCASLKRLVLKPNPVCRLFPDLYFHLLVHQVPSLEMLDGKKVGDAERDAAAAFINSPAGKQALREAGIAASRRGVRPPLPPLPPADEGKGQGVAVGFEQAMGKLERERAEGEGARPVGRRSSSKKLEGGDGKEGAGAEGEQRALKKKGSTIWQRQRAKEEAKEAAVVGDARLLSHRAAGQGDGEQGNNRPQETILRYGRNGPVALVLRPDGTGEARYEAGQVAVSADAGRITAMYRNGDVAVTADERGSAMVCMASGTVVYSHIEDKGGRLQDVITGKVTREWGGDVQAENDGRGGDVLNCRLSDNLGVRVKALGGQVEVFFVCDSGRRGERIKQVFRQYGGGGPMRPEWESGGPFGDGHPPTREPTAPRGPDVKSEDFRYDIRSAVENIVDFQALRENLGSQEQISLAPAEKKDPLLPQGSGAARRAAYAQALKEQGRGGSWTAGSKAGSVAGRTRRGSQGGSSVVSAGTTVSGRGGGGSERRASGVSGLGSARSRGSEGQEDAEKGTLRRMRQEMGKALDDLPMEWELGGGEAARRPGGYGRRAGREGAGVLSGPAANAGAGVPAGRQGAVLRGGGSAKEVGGGVAGEKKGRGKKEKAPPAEPDLPEEELERLQAIRDQMKNMVAALSMAPGYS